MSLLDNVRQTIESATETALDAGQTASVRTQAQLRITKLQIERARKFHDLGAKAYAAYKAGRLDAEAAPAELRALFEALDANGAEIDEQNRKIEEARLEAELRAKAKAEAAASGQASATPAGKTTVTQVPAAPAGGGTPADRETAEHGETAAHGENAPHGTEVAAPPFVPPPVTDTSA